MRSIDRLVSYFLDGLDSYPFADRVGAEIETSFVDKNASPITMTTSQQIFHGMVNTGWTISDRKGELLTEIVSPDGDRMLYELGRSNIELSLAPQKPNELIAYMTQKLNELCSVAGTAGAKVWEKPILPGTEDLLVIPDERDATWLELDGRKALMPLARTSCVQFTIDVPPERAIAVLNNLGDALPTLLPDYPQEGVWRRYVAESKARYRGDRYGGPIHFSSIEQYCTELTKHDAIVNGKLVPHEEVEDLNIPLFIRSVWWYFRLRRFGRRLCIEVRPLPRRGNGEIAKQLELIGRLCRGWDKDPYSDTVRCQCDKCFFRYGNSIYTPKPVRDWSTPQIYYNTLRPHSF